MQYATAALIIAAATAAVPALAGESRSAPGDLTATLVSLHSYDPAERRAAADRLKRIELAPAEREAVRQRIIRQLRSEPLDNDRGTRSLIEVLSALNVDLAETLIDAVREGDELLALSLVKSIRYRPLSGAGYQQLAIGLRLLMKNVDPDVRLRAIEVAGLLRVRASATLSELREKLLDGDPRVRYRAAVALDRIDDHSEATVASLADATGDHSFLVAERAAKALGRFGSSASPALSKLEEIKERVQPRMQEELLQTIAAIRRTATENTATAKAQSAGSTEAQGAAVQTQEGVVAAKAQNSAVTAKTEGTARAESLPVPTSFHDGTGLVAMVTEINRDYASATGRFAPRARLRTPAGPPPAPPIELASNELSPPITDLSKTELPSGRDEVRTGERSIPAVNAHPPAAHDAPRPPILESDLAVQDGRLPSPITARSPVPEAHGKQHVLPPREPGSDFRTRDAGDDSAVVLAALGDDNPDTRADAAMKSAELQLSGGEIQEALRKALDDSSQKVRFAAGYALGAMGPAGLQVLAEESRNENPLVRMSAIQAIKGVRPVTTEVHSLLEERLTYDTEQPVRIKAAVAVLQLDPVHPAAIEFLISQLAAETDQIRIAAVEGLRRADTEKVTSAALEQLQGNDELAKLGALAACELLKLKDMRIETAVKMLRDDPSPAVQSAAARIAVGSTVH